MTDNACLDSIGATMNLSSTIASYTDGSRELYGPFRLFPYKNQPDCIFTRCMEWIFDHISESGSLISSELPFKPARFCECEPTAQSLPSNYSCSNQKTYSFWISAIECYNEKIFDLLNDGPVNSVTKTKQSLEVKHSSRFKGGTFVDGMCYTRVSNLKQAMNVIEKALHNREIEGNRSASHCMVYVHVLEFPSGFSSDRLTKEYSNQHAVIVKRLVFADLIGSQNSFKSMSTSSGSCTNNKSISVLQNCLATIRSNHFARTINKPTQHVPFRNSKLTQILQPDLQQLPNTGVKQPRFVLLASVDASPEKYDHTVQVLEFSAITRELQAVRARVDSNFSASKQQQQLDSMKRSNTSPAPKSMADYGSTPEIAIAAQKSPLTFLHKTNNNNNTNQTSGNDSNDGSALSHQKSQTQIESEIRQRIMAEQFDRTEKIRSQYEQTIQEIYEDTEKKMTKKLDILSRSYEQDICELQEQIKSLKESVRLKQDENQKLRSSALGEIDKTNLGDSESKLQQIIRQSEKQIKEIELLASEELKRISLESEQKMTEMQARIVKMKERLTVCEKENAQLKRENQKLHDKIQDFEDELKSKPKQAVDLAVADKMKKLSLSSHSTSNEELAYDKENTPASKSRASAAPKPMSPILSRFGLKQSFYSTKTSSSNNSNQPGGDAATRGGIKKKKALRQKKAIFVEDE